MITECELGPSWTVVGIDEAVKIPKGTRDMRCPACRGRVYLHRTYSKGTPAHFEHEIAHAGCPLSDYHYAGVPVSHLHAIK